MATPATMSLLVFGATGGTGTHFIDLALAAGHSITAIVRNPEAIRQRHLNLHIRKGDVLQPDTFASLVHGQDAIVSCLGSRDLKPTTVYSAGVDSMLSAMQTAGVSRLLCISASGIEVNPKAGWVLRLATRHVLQRIFRNLYADTRLMEKILKQSNVNWTSVRPPMLTNGPLTGQYRYKVNAFLTNCFRLSRADLAHFIVHHLTDPATFQAVVEVSN